ncbi:uncharacterized protein [Clytia hemisphaerica]|uniref:uncharacterized protein n=1 Tax=Clytia hemisphaerica TaxID=252671 RepID=UPI0034D41172
MKFVALSLIVLNSVLLVQSDDGFCLSVFDELENLAPTLYHHEDCTKYFICLRVDLLQQVMTLERECQNGKFFDEEQKKCLRERTPRCEATTKSTEATTESTEATTESSKATTKSTEATTKSTEATTKSTEATTKSTEATTKPTEATTKSTEATTKPTEATTKSIEATTQSTEATTKLTEATTKSTEATTKSTEATTKSTEATTKSTEATTEPTEATTESTEATTKPTEATTKSTEATTKSTEATTKSTESTTKSTEATTKSTEATTKPTEATTKSTEATTKPTEATTKSKEATTESTEATTKSTEATTKPTEATTESTEATTQSTEATTKSTELTKPERAPTTITESTIKPAIEIAATEVAQLTTEKKDNKFKIGKFDRNFCINYLDGFYSHPNECDLYYRCVTSVTHFGQCPEDTFFHEAINGCVRRENAKCTKTSEPDATNLQPTTPETSSPEDTTTETTVPTTFSTKDTTETTQPKTEDNIKSKEEEVTKLATSPQTTESTTLESSTQEPSQATIQATKPTTEATTQTTLEPVSTKGVETTQFSTQTSSASESATSNPTTLAETTGTTQQTTKPASTVSETNTDQATQSTTEQVVQSTTEVEATKPATQPDTTTEQTQSTTVAATERTKETKTIKIVDEDFCRTNQLTTGWHANEFDCSKYYQCVEERTFVRMCAKNTFFHPRFICVSKELAVCTKIPESENSATTETVTTTPESTTQSTESTTQATESTTQATESTTQATEGTTQATESTTRSTESTTQSTESTTQATESTTQATEGTTQSTESTTQAIESTTQATESTTQATESTTQATEGTTQATESTTRSTEGTAQSTESTTQAIESTTQATESTTQAIESTTQATESTTQATESTTQATESTTQEVQTTKQAITIGETIIDKDFCLNHEDGFHPNPSDCRELYQCLRKRTFPRSCSSGLLYDSIAVRCKDADLVNCDLNRNGVIPKTTQAPPPAEATEAPKTKNTPEPTHNEFFCEDNNLDQGYYPDPKDCKSFYRCFNQAGQLKTKFTVCAGTLLYDSVNIRCEWPNVVDCNLNKGLTTTPVPLPAYAGKYPIATACNKATCTLKNKCKCAGTDAPHPKLTATTSPKIVIFSMDDSLGSSQYNVISEILDGRVNPNGCPVTGTMFVSMDSVQSLRYPKLMYDKGHEIAVHTKSHRFPTTYWKTVSYKALVDEIVDLRDQMFKAGIKNVVGYRNPFLQTSGDTLFTLLKDFNFRYDSSLPTPAHAYWWPYTMEHKVDYCAIPPCPTKSYKGFYEVPLEIVKNRKGGLCSMFDEPGCWRNSLQTADETYDYFKENFERHFTHGSSPFPIHGHANNLLGGSHGPRKEGLIRFLDELMRREDVYMVGFSKLIDFMENPKTLEELKTEGTDGIFSCEVTEKKARSNERPRETFSFMTTSTTTTPAPTPGAFDDATVCDSSTCNSNTCRCPSPKTPGGLSKEDTPKIILFGMDDGMTQEKYDLFVDMTYGKANPNGCPVQATFFISADYTFHAIAKKLYDNGHEIADHSMSHKLDNDYWKDGSYQAFINEIIPLRKQFHDEGITKVTGYRQPLLQTGGDNTFSVLHNFGFQYDSSMVTKLNDRFWPYTLDHKIPNCVIEPCPTKSYKGLWEIAIEAMEGPHGEACSLYDDFPCWKQLKTSQDVYTYMKKNFDRHFATGTSPFPIWGHLHNLVRDANTFRRQGLQKFLDEIAARDDTYFVTNQQLLDWMKDPKTLSQLKNRATAGAFSCKENKVIKPDVLSGDLAVDCDPKKCSSKTCRCPSNVPPSSISSKDVPKFVLLTMDDDMSNSKYNAMRDILGQRTNPNGCPIKATFFLSTLGGLGEIRKLQSLGHEIACHTESHRNSQSYWKRSKYQTYKREIVDYRDKLSKAGIKEVRGYRQPYLQTGGDTTYKVLHDHDFLYDSSLPTALNEGLWPYTLDYKIHKCVIPPCPKGSYDGLWQVPIEIYQNQITGHKCSLFDEPYCWYNLLTEDQTYDYFMANFERHFSEGRTSPFPMAGHLLNLLNGVNKTRREGMIRFMDTLLKKDDVYFVTMTELIRWMQDPKTLTQMKSAKNCK